MSYNRTRFFTTPAGKKIKYCFLNKKSQITVVFFHGFMSDMVGKKPIAIQNFCKKQKINFLRFEYSGHGKSSGKFTDGNISKWTRDSKQLIKSKTQRTQKLLFVGSSMGSWIALNLFPSFKKKIKGFIGIASAPEFLEKLMWNKFSKKTKKNILKNNIYYLKHGDFVYPLTKQLIMDGKKNRILTKKINLKIQITLLHGLKDEVVPLSFSRKILRKCKSAKNKLIKIKNGKHNLSRKKDLELICRELNNMIFNHI